MLNIILAVIARDLKLAMRRQADIVSALFFFVIVVSLFPLGIGPEMDMLRRIAPGILWLLVFYVYPSIQMFIASFWRSRPSR